MDNVCLLLEGTYPYVSGGVSACVHQLIQMLPKIGFHLVYIGASSKEMLTPKYKIPSNVVGLQEVFLFDDVSPKLLGKKEFTKRERGALDFLHGEIHRATSQHGTAAAVNTAYCVDALQTLFPSYDENKVFRHFSSFAMWSQLVTEYEALGGQVPFIDFFYTWRSAHIPLYKILAYRYPRAEVYHALCTGYAGLAGVAASVQHSSPLFITEHGIYAHERAIEIAEADWFTTGHRTLNDEATEVIRRWWIDMFLNLSRVAYAFASEIITLYEGNRKREIKDGAHPERTKIIPNGISLRFKGLRRKNPSWAGAATKSVFRLGFVGRVVAIKDVKTLIKAVRTIVEEYPHVICRIIGPTDEEKEYFDQCSELVKVLGLEKTLIFEGKKNVIEVYPELDCVLLTSISEAQPLVLLEANLAGVPAVATRVGSCDDILNGYEEGDKLLGPSGLIAPIADPEAIAAQVLRLIEEPELWEQMSLAGIERVTSFYDERILISKYDLLYRQHMAKVVRLAGHAPGELPWQASASA